MHKNNIDDLEARVSDLENLVERQWSCLQLIVIIIVIIIAIKIISYIF